MRSWTLLGLSLLSLCLILPSVQGNMPPSPYLPKPPAQFEFKFPLELQPKPVAPGRREAQEINLVVQVDEKAKTARLLVPIHLVVFHPLLTPPAPPAKPEGRGAGAGRLGLPTLATGLALTLAFTSGGLWLARRRSGRAFALLLILSVSIAGTAAVWADIAPRPAPDAHPAAVALSLPASVELTDKLILEPVLDGDHLTLIVPKSSVLKKDNKASTEKEKPAK